MTERKLAGRLRHIDGHLMGDEVTGVILTIHGDGPMTARTGTLSVNDDPTFVQNHHGKTFMFFAENATVHQPFDIHVIDESGTVTITMVPAAEMVG